MINSFTGKYRFLSNFSDSSHFYIKIDNNPVLARTVEHAYQSYKTTNTDDKKRILAASTPGYAKRMGKTLHLRSDWEAVKIPIMRFCLEAKFNNSLILKKQLIDTGDEILVEGNTWGDTFWGTCNGVGNNWLGFLLMGLRAELRGQ